MIYLCPEFKDKFDLAIWAIEETNRRLPDYIASDIPVISTVTIPNKRQDFSVVGISEGFDEVVNALDVEVELDEKGIEYFYAAGGAAMFVNMEDKEECGE